MREVRNDEPGSPKFGDDLAPSRKLPAAAGGQRTGGEQPAAGRMCGCRGGLTGCPAAGSAIPAVTRDVERRAGDIEMVAAW